MPKLRKKFISYLLILAVGLLFINIIVDAFKNKNVKQEEKELSRIEVESTLWKVLDDYGINANWVTKKKYHEKDEDSIKAEYFISIPAEVPIPLIIRDVNLVLGRSMTSFVAKEKKNFGLTEIKIYTNEYLKLKATLTPDSKITRLKNEFAFVINNVFDLNEKQYQLFLSTHYPLACSVVPNSDLMSQADSLSNYSKDYLVLLNDEISDSKMKLVREYNKDLLLSSIKNIRVAFRKSSIVAVDESSVLYRSPIYNFVRDEFSRRRINLVPLNWLIRLETNDENELYSKFNFYAKDTTVAKQKIFYTSFANFELLQPLIEKFEKKGNRVIPITQTKLKK